MENMNEKIEDSFSMENIAKNAVDVIRPNKILKGEVVTIDNDFVYVNVGTKSDGRISLDEFAEKPGVGDIIDIMLINKRMIDGMYSFSKEAAERVREWERFVALTRDGSEYISGKVMGTNSKGLIVDCNGVNAFLPFSQAADARFKKGVGENQLYVFKIKNIDDKKKSIVLSRKEYLEESRDKVWADLEFKYKVGDKIRGKVTRFVDFGVFVDIGGVEGLLYKNDLSWKTVFKKKKLLRIDEEREFVLLGINREEGKISLGLKQLVEDPWLRINERYKAGQTVEGKVVTLAGQGIFIEIEDGVEGFLHASDVSWTKKTAPVKGVFTKGQQVTVKVLEINPEERKMVFGMKQLLENPWDTIDTRLPVGSVHTKPVKKVVSFGLFVELDDEVDGLVHLSDISWDDSIKDPVSMYKVGDMVTVKILDIKKDEMKISCGIKQLTKSPWEAVKEKYTPRTRVSGTISSITSFGLFVKLDDDIEGLVHISEVSRRKIEDLKERFNVGDTVNALVLGVDVERKRLSLSIKQHEIISEKEELSKIIKENTPGKVTIGDLIKMKQGE